MEYRRYEEGWILLQELRRALSKIFSLKTLLCISYPDNPFYGENITTLNCLTL